MKHDVDDDGCCLHCGFDAVEFHHQAGHIFPGMEYAEPMPACPVTDKVKREENQRVYRATRDDGWAGSGERIRMARIEWVRQRLENWALWHERGRGGGLGYATQSVLLAERVDGDRQAFVPVDEIEAA
jgi:hypothetical protein